MKKKTIVNLSVIAVALIAVVILAIVLPTETMVECPDCEGVGLLCETCEGTGQVAANSKYYATFMSLVPPIIAITLALITKEVYSSLFIGVVAGGLFYANFNPVGALDAITVDGIISAVEGTAGIFAFLVLLGAVVALLNKAGGSKAFGRWALDHVKTRAGAIFVTFLLGVVIFVDDYFNCLTVGSVMRPLCDNHKISRVKLAYIIDATAAPICMIAPISSWAAAVSEFVGDENGLVYFIKAIPYNYYSLLTIVFILFLTFMSFDYGKMSLAELKAKNEGILGELEQPEENPEEKGVVDRTPRARVYDLIVPIAALIVSCVLTLLYVGGFFTAGSGVQWDLAHSFGNTDATVALPLGSVISLIFIIIYLMARRLIDFSDAMSSLPKGFIAMVPAILILTLATALKNTTGLLGSDVFVAEILENAGALKSLLPAIIFLIACGLAFATGTSWGTFGILIPIVESGIGLDNELGIIAMSACLAGAVCGDHCSPISDTTIMASAGAQCNHVEHVSTQLPYVITVAAVSFVSYIITGFVQTWFISLPIAIVLMIAAVFGIKFFVNKKSAEI